MKIRMVEGKQVGILSYMTDNIGSLISIIHNQVLYSSEHLEKNPATNKRERSVAFSRVIGSQSARNSKRWVYGVIIDGDRLSDRYKISPYSFVGSALSSGNTLRLRYITKYDDGSYELNLVNWGTFKIDEQTYADIIRAIKALPEEFKQKKQLIRQGASTRPYRGKSRVERYQFLAKTGGMKLSEKMLSGSGVNLSKNARTNEFEERIWTADSPSISIKNCIIGIVIPKRELNNFNNETTEDFIELKEELENILGQHYQVVTY